ncbi:hypothetical protein [Streptomyces sp. Ru71]|uniref:hypothetical protein n=1 Tax=Streptomyces sp. Ru71 TaxID=2080746 RepID=UPI0021566B2C|nr:hypothetical protein [Streptomyces sp. Ru71]
MLLLGLLLLAATVAFTVLAIAGNLGGGPQYPVSVLDHHIATMNGLALFSSGLALALIFCLALAMMSGAVHRRRRAPRGVGTADDADDADDRTTLHDMMHRPHRHA